MTVDSADDYIFAGGGQLTGPFPLTVTGGGTVTLNGAHSFSGGIAINQGTLKPGGNQALGANGQVITIAAGATLDTNGAMNANREYER
jgi:fibronectin-binding autotransporter adhesin